MQMDSNEKALFSVPEAARRWSVSERWVWKAIAERRLDAVKLGRSTRIRAMDVERVSREGLATGAR